MALAALFGYLVRLILARNLDPSSYGLFYSILAFIGIFSLFKDLGLGQAITILIPKFLVRKEFENIKSAIISAISIQFIISIFFAGAFIYVSDYLAINYFKVQFATIVIIFLAFSQALRPIGFMYAHIFQGFQKMKYYASIDFIRMAIIFIICLIGFNFSNEILSIGTYFNINLDLLTIPSFAYLITPFFLLIIYAPFLFKKTFPQFFKVKLKIKKTLIKRLLGLGVPLMISTAGWIILGHTDTLMITYFSTLDQVGFYNVAMPSANILGYISLVLISVLFPMTSELWEKNQKKKISQGIEFLHKYSVALILPLIMLMVTFPDLIISLLFGSKYIYANNALRILSIGMLFLTVARINISALSGIGKPKIGTKIVLMVVLLNILFNFILIPLWGIIGAAITTIGGFFIMMVASNVSLNKFIKIKLPIVGWLNNILIAIFFLFTITVLKYFIKIHVLIELPIVILIASLIYIKLLFLLKVINMKEINDLIKLTI